MRGFIASTYWFSLIFLLGKTLYSEKMMNPASKTPPNKMSPIKTNIGIGDSSLDEPFFFFVLFTFFPAPKTSVKLSV
jgi:hypothetical protein